MGCREQTQACTWPNREGTFLVAELQLLFSYAFSTLTFSTGFAIRGAMTAPAAVGAACRLIPRGQVRTWLPGLSKDKEGALSPKRPGHGLPVSLTRTALSPAPNRLGWTGSGGGHQRPHSRRRSAGRYEALASTSHWKLMIKYVTYAAFAIHAAEISESI